MTVPALLFVDRWGRRPTLLIGAALMCIFMFANAGMMGGAGEVVEGGIQGVKQQSMRVSGAPAKGLIACTYLFVASYAPTWGKSRRIPLHSFIHMLIVIRTCVMGLPARALPTPCAW